MGRPPDSKAGGLRIWAVLLFFLPREWLLGFAAQERVGWRGPRHGSLQIGNHHSKLGGQPVEQGSLLLVRREITDQLAFGRLHTQLFQMGLQILHRRSPFSGESGNTRSDLGRCLALFKPDCQSALCPLQIRTAGVWTYALAGGKRPGKSLGWSGRNLHAQKKPAPEAASFSDSGFPGSALLAFQPIGQSAVLALHLFEFFPGFLVSCDGRLNMTLALQRTVFTVRHCGDPLT